MPWLRSAQRLLLYENRFFETGRIRSNSKIYEAEREDLSVLENEFKVIEAKYEAILEEKRQAIEAAKRREEEIARVNSAAKKIQNAWKVTCLGRGRRKRRRRNGEKMKEKIRNIGELLTFFHSFFFLSPLIFLSFCLLSFSLSFPFSSFWLSSFWLSSFFPLERYDPLFVQNKSCSITTNTSVFFRFNRSASIYIWYCCDKFTSVMTSSYLIGWLVLPAVNLLVPFFA